MTAPDISVVLPVYNAAATIEATVRSVLAQTHTQFELVAIDDGSSDDSLARLLAIAAQDARIRVIARSNHGVSDCRNLGVEMCRSALVAFIDSDDLWVPEKLAEHLACHRQDPGLAASYARIAFIDQQAGGVDGARTHSSLCPHPPKLLDILGENPICTASNLVIRRDWFLSCGEFDVGLSHAEDQDLLARVVARQGRIAGIDAVLVGYRYSPDGLSMDLERMHRGWRQVAGAFLADRDLAPLEAVYFRYLARRQLRSGGSPLAAIRLVMAGLERDLGAFFKERRRGIATLIAALLAPVMPRPLRRRLFA